MKILLIFLTLFGLEHMTAPDAIKVYPVRKIEGALNVSGRGDDPLWKHAALLEDFTYPWENDIPHPTRFRALHNADWVYCLFEVTDPDVHIFQEQGDKWEVAASSRAEIFFRIDEQLSPYYCLEIDPLARVLDYRGNYHRKFDRGWSWPENGMVVKSHHSATGYTIEVGFTKSSLQQLGLLKDNLLQAGLYRADCLPGKNGERVFKWISWVPPASPSPDFHIPSSFGKLELEN